MKRVLFFLLFCCSTWSVFSQVLNIQVTSKSDGQPIAYANAVLLPSYVSTVTDKQGSFTLEVENLSDTLVVQSIGFQPFKAVVKNVLSLRIIQLEVEKIQVDDVLVTVKKRKKRNRKVDPAYLLHSALVQHKNENDFRSTKSYSCETYNKLQVDVNNVTKETRDVIIFRPIAFLFDDIDSTSLPKSFVPILFGESTATFHHGENGGEKEIVNGSKLSGLEIPSLSKFTGSSYLSYNVYDEYINIFQKSFVSPLANNSWITYNFYITDSVKSGDTTNYKLEFIPRRKNELAFKGELWTDNKTYAVHNIKLEILRSANINYVNHFVLNLDYLEKDGDWLLSGENIFMDVFLANNIYGFYIKKQTDFLNYEYPVAFEKGYFNVAERSETWDSIAEYGDQRIEEVKPENEDTTENPIYGKMDSVVNTPYVKFLKNLALMSYSSYYPFKYFEVGPYSSYYSFNPIEGNRFRLGGASMTKLFPKTQLYGHLAYGTKDKVLKGRFRVTHFFNLKNWRYVRLGVIDDYSILSMSSNAFMVDNIISSLSRRVNPRFTRLKRYSGEWFHSWYSGVENYIMLNWDEYRPVGSLNYQQPDLTNLSLIRMNTIKLGGRVALDQKFLNYGFRRLDLRTRKPKVSYELTQGVILDDQGYEFTKLEIDFLNKFYVGFMGYIRVYATAGKVWGTLPYPMLLNHAGNDSYYWDSKAFSLMSPFEFVSDEQVTLMLSHHFNGLIMNQIPLIKKFHWRTLVFGRGAMGNLSESHEGVVLLPEGLSALKEPYVEAGFGIQNIFKLFRVDFIWRLTNMDNNPQRFGVNFAVEPRL